MATPDDRANLRDLLARVHERLHRAATVDPETRGLLVTLTHDIERALGRSPDSSPADDARRAPANRESLATLKGLAARFDADHLALAQTLRELADLLGKVGL
ncbi:MAG: DUF4404 family protein [Steroidobacteraceae bacterium]